MSQPNLKQLKSGASILNAPMTAGAPAVNARAGDVVTHPSGSGWHVCIVANAVVPVGGLQENHSSDQFRWSKGASYSGQGVPCTATSQTFDQAQTGYGTDGRISGGATGTPSF